MDRCTPGSSQLILWTCQPSNECSIHLNGSYIEWIQKTATPQFQEIRDRIESLWRRLPENQRHEYTRRLRSMTCTDFLSAYSELWWRDALEQGGLRVLQPEATPGGSTPDWTLADDDKCIAAVECYLRTEPEEDLRVDHALRSWFDAAYKKLTNKRIRIRVRNVTPDTRTPSATQLARRLDHCSSAASSTGGSGEIDDDRQCAYKDPQSNWSFNFSWRVPAMPAEGLPQLCEAWTKDAYFHNGTDLFRNALRRKAGQHRSSQLPVVICVAWNCFAHEPDLQEISNIVREQAVSLSVRRVYGVFWATSVWPWNAAAAPRLLHWGSDESARLSSRWSGPVFNVMNATPA